MLAVEMLMMLCSGTHALDSPTPAVYGDLATANLADFVMGANGDVAYQMSG